MTTALLEDEVRSYVAQVSSFLDDLPEDERCDLLEDLEMHLREVAAEGEGSLRDRLGPPDAYADELRASAGLPVRGVRMVAAGLAARAARSWPVRAAHTAAAHPVVRRIRSFLPELRPAWWVMRGYVLALYAAYVWGSGGYGGDVYDGLSPYNVLHSVSTFALAVVGIWASVALGRRGRSSRRRRFTSIGFTVAASLVLLGAASSARPTYASDYQDYYIEEMYPEHLRHRSGDPISNICPYAIDGTPLEGVLLFDQEGKAIRNIASEDRQGRYIEDAGVVVMPNAYPRPQRIVDAEELYVGIDDYGEPYPIDRRVRSHRFRCPDVVVPNLSKETDRREPERAISKRR